MALGQPAREGGEDCWTILSVLHNTHYCALVRLAAIYLDRPAAEDAVQDAFVRVSLRWGGIRESDKVLLYLRRTVMNLAKGQLRHRRVVRRHAEVRPAASPETEDVALGNLADDAIVRAIRRLPRQQAACIGLRFYLNLSEKETAEVLGILPGSVKQHTSRARRKLAPVLGVSTHD